MGTYLGIKAPDAVLEQIAGAAAGTARIMRAMDAMHTAAYGADFETWQEVDRAYNAGIASRGAGVDDLALLVVDGLGRLMARDELAAAGHEWAYGYIDLTDPAQRALGIEVLRLQRRRWGRRSGVRLGGITRAEWAATARRYRRVCDGLIAAARDGRLTGIGWS